MTQAVFYNKLNLQNTTLDDDCRKMLLQAEQVKSLLIYCSHNPGAKVQIVVTHDDGQVATANLYDHAALTQGLIDVIDYFQDEML